MLKILIYQRLKYELHLKTRKTYQSFYDWLINQPTNNLTTDDAMAELKNRLIKLGCTHLEVEYFPEYLETNKGV